LSTSIRRGVQAATSTTTALVIALGDEPRVSGDVSRSVISAWRQTGRPIVVARYAGETGHPVLFDARVFGELTTLDGDRGAKRVIDRLPERVAYVDIATALPIDVDNVADLRLLGDASSRTGD
jgi:molybdenum cofactor cytidylyltransferase